MTNVFFLLLALHEYLNSNLILLRLSDKHDNLEVKYELYL